jgi:hypothetical protein
VLHFTGPLDPQKCEGLKKKGVLVSVLYVTYYIPPGVSVREIEPFKSRILPNLKACASSPELFFNASQPADIATALQGMLKAVQGSGKVRLTN